MRQESVGLEGLKMNEQNHETVEKTAENNETSVVSATEEKKKDKASLKTRIITALVLLCIGVPCILIGGWLFTAFILIITCAITYEILRAPIFNPKNMVQDEKKEAVSEENPKENQEDVKLQEEKAEEIVVNNESEEKILTKKEIKAQKKKEEKEERDKLYEVITDYEKEIFRNRKFSIIIYVTMYVMMISFVFWLYTNPSLVQFSGDGFSIIMYDIRISTLALAFFVALLFFNVLIEDDFTVHHACYLFTLGIFCSIAIQSVLFLRYCPEGLYNLMIRDESEPLFHYDNFMEQCLLLIYVVGGALITDAYAYFVGRTFGKNKLNPRISPKKTWEGFVGGCVLASVTGIAFCFICDALGSPVLKGLLDINHWYWCIVFSILISVVSVLGDFMFSAIKRFYKIKDFGTILPGHGGLLDRFDSVLITSLVTSCLILFIVYSPWNALIK